MANILSEYIKVFPAVQRNLNYNQHRLTEQNIVDVVKHITGEESYLISTNFDSKIIFVIGGYCFTINTWNAIDNTLGNITKNVNDYLIAEIELSDDGNNLLSGADQANTAGAGEPSNATYDGLNFNVTSDYTANNNTTLILAQYNGTTWVPYAPSLCSRHDNKWLDFTSHII